MNPPNSWWASLQTGRMSGPNASEPCSNRRRSARVEAKVLDSCINPPTAIRMSLGLAGRGHGEPVPPVHALDAVAVQAEDAVEPAQLHPLDARVLTGEPFEDLQVELNLLVDVPPHQPAEHAEAARRAGPIRFRVRERHQVGPPLVNRGEEDIQPPAHLALATGLRVGPPVVVDRVDRGKVSGPV